MSSSKAARKPALSSSSMVLCCKRVLISGSLGKQGVNPAHILIGRKTPDSFLLFVTASYIALDMGATLLPCQYFVDMPRWAISIIRSLRKGEGRAIIPSSSEPPSILAKIRASGWPENIKPLLPFQVSRNDTRGIKAEHETETSPRQVFYRAIVLVIKLPINAKFMASK